MKNFFGVELDSNVCSYMAMSKQFDIQGCFVTCKIRTAVQFKWSHVYAVTVRW
jgi:hypothetical protein